jgi:hypothetical protein
MGNYDDYKHESTPRLQPGDYRLEVLSVEEAESKTSHKPMIVITVRPNNSIIKIKQYIVKNEYFNRNMTDFFESFGIEEGNFNFMTWIGAMGAAKLAADDQGYMKVKYFLDPERAEKLPPWSGPVPERQTVTSLDEGGFVEVDGEETPF